MKTWCECFSCSLKLKKLAAGRSEAKLYSDMKKTMGLFFALPLWPFYSLERSETSCWSDAKLVFCVLFVESYLCTLQIKMLENKAEAEIILIKMEVKTEKRQLLLSFMVCCCSASTGGETSALVVSLRIHRGCCERHLEGLTGARALQRGRWRLKTCHIVWSHQDRSEIASRPAATR